MLGWLDGTEETERKNKPKKGRKLGKVGENSHGFQGIDLKKLCYVKVTVTNSFEVLRNKTAMQKIRLFTTLFGSKIKYNQDFKAKYGWDWDDLR